MQENKHKNMRLSTLKLFYLSFACDIIYLLSEVNVVGQLY